MSGVLRNPVYSVFDQWAVQYRFKISDFESRGIVSIYVAKNKGADQLRKIGHGSCTLVFTYAKGRFI